MKFIHLADVHLGAEPESGTPLGALRKEEIWEAFREVITRCENEQTDLLLIAGDLFHGQPLLREVREADYLFRKLTKTKVVMIAGNHDCLFGTSHYYDVTFPEHVTFLMDTQADSVYFPELNTEVFGLSYEEKKISDARYDRIQIREKERINILLAHGNIYATDNSIPLRRDVIERQGFDYAALGHLHTRVEISERIAYTGSFEPLDKKETGPKGYIRGEIRKEGECSKLYREFVPHAKRQYIPVSLTVTQDATEISLCEALWGEILEIGKQHMYLVKLTGTRAKELVLDTERITEVVEKQGGFVIECRDETIPDFSVDRLLTEHRGTLVGRFIERMQAEESREIAELALQYGLQALLARDERK